MGRRDDIGNRGESVFRVLITNFCGRQRPYFRETFLGEKHQTFDFMVDLIGSRFTTAYFFVQVKTTTLGYIDTLSGRRLNVKVTREDVERLRKFPAPAYVAGIDLQLDHGFILCAHAKLSGGISGLPTLHPIDCKNLKLLWQEVNSYWRAKDMLQNFSHFLG